MEAQQARLEAFLEFAGLLTNGGCQANLARGGHAVTAASLAKAENEAPPRPPPAGETRAADSAHASAHGSRGTGTQAIQTRGKPRALRSREAVHKGAVTAGRTARTPTPGTPTRARPAGSSPPPGQRRPRSRTGGGGVATSNHADGQTTPPKNALVAPVPIFGTPKTPVGVAKLTDGGERAVQSLFEAYCAWGSRPNSTYLEWPKFARFCRDRRILGRRVTIGVARQTFCVARQSKHDPSLPEERISFWEFMDVLSALAVLIYPHARPQDALDRLIVERVLQGKGTDDPKGYVVRGGRDSEALLTWNVLDIFSSCEHLIYIVHMLFSDVAEGCAENNTSDALVMSPPSSADDARMGRSDFLQFAHAFRIVPQLMDENEAESHYQAVASLTAAMPHQIIAAGRSGRGGRSAAGATARDGLTCHEFIEVIARIAAATEGNPELAGGAPSMKSEAQAAREAMGNSGAVAKNYVTMKRSPSPVPLPEELSAKSVFAADHPTAPSPSRLAPLEHAQRLRTTPVPAHPPPPEKKDHAFYNADSFTADPAYYIMHNIQNPANAIRLDAPKWQRRYELVAAGGGFEGRGARTALKGVMNQRLQEEVKDWERSVSVAMHIQTCHDSMERAVQRRERLGDLVCGIAPQASAPAGEFDEEFDESMMGDEYGEEDEVLYENGAEPWVRKADEEVASVMKNSPEARGAPAPPPPSAVPSRGLPPLAPASRTPSRLLAASFFRPSSDVRRAASALA